MKTILPSVICLFMSAMGAAQEMADRSFTPVGAERAGNSDGSIPEWTGGLTPLQWPQGFKPGGRHLDPFPDDQPRLAITAANYREHAGKLSLGHQALFARFSTYTMPVYPTRRSVSFPDAIQAATQLNLKRTKVVGADAIEGARRGLPFANPRTGVEVIWNHRLRYRGNNAIWDTTQSVRIPGGAERRMHIEEWMLSFYATLKDTGADSPKNMLHHTVFRAEPVKSCGQHIWLWHETLNALEKSRNAWYACLWKSGRVPFVGHDDFSMASERLRYFDMLDMFTGEFDRYTFKLVGKRELFIPYNSYRLSDGRYTDDQLLTLPHFNQDGARYELHRVWVVEASLRPGATHNIGKRVFYVDEDSWTIAVADLYDRSGKLWRLQEGHVLPLYEVQAVEPAPQVVYGLTDGRYFASRLTGQRPAPRFNVPELSAQDFSPTRIKRYQQR